VAAQVTSAVAAVSAATSARGRTRIRRAYARRRADGLDG
jgi:hypothetical protein